MGGPAPRWPYLLLATAGMLGALLAARWALAGPLGEMGAALSGAAVAAAIGALVIGRAAPHGDPKAIAALHEQADRASAKVEAAQKELDLLSGILDGMVDGVVVFDRGGHIVQANLAARRLAVSADEVLGKSAIEAFRNAALAGAVERALRSGEAGDREIDMGGVLPRRLLVQTSRRAGKEASGVIVVLHDVTELRRLETIRTELVANVSHELRTPVTAITSAAETLLGGALDDRRDAEEFVEIIDRNARRLRTLVEDLLDLSKIEAKGYRLAPAEEALGPVFSQARKLAEGAARKRRMRVVVEDPDLTAAWIDRHAFEQVLSNLLDNAIKYAGEGATVLLRAKVVGERVAVSVTDTGTGIAPQHLDRLFERFYRVDAGRSREVGGTGLGLAIVKHLVEAMDGEIAVESELGRGTTFTIHVPRGAPARESPDPENPDGDAPSGTEGPQGL